MWPGMGQDAQAFIFPNQLIINWHGKSHNLGWSSYGQLSQSSIESKGEDSQEVGPQTFTKEKSGKYLQASNPLDSWCHFDLLLHMFQN